MQVTPPKIRSQINLSQLVINRISKCIPRIHMSRFGSS